MHNALFFLFLLKFSFSLSQSIHPLEPAVNHYRDFQKLSLEPTLERAALDTIKFFPKSYNAVALLYTMIPPKYLSDEQIIELKSSLEFPANSSEQTMAELEFLLNWQDKRTEAQETRAAKVLAPIGYWPHIGLMEDHENYKENIEHLFFEGRAILGESCTEANYPATAKLLKAMTNDMRIMEFTVKYYLLRARPYELEPKLKPLQIMGSPSFASGHTLWAYIHAYAWSELLPEKRAEFLALAYEIGESREIMGIHYPSDEEAARLLAHRMLKAMWTNQQFVSDFKKAKLEWTK